MHLIESWRHVLQYTGFETQWYAVLHRWRTYFFVLNFLDSTRCFWLLYLAKSAFRTSWVRFKTLVVSLLPISCDFERWSAHSAGSCRSMITISQSAILNWSTVCVHYTGIDRKCMHSVSKTKWCERLYSTSSFLILMATSWTRSSEYCVNCQLWTSCGDGGFVYVDARALPV